MQLVVTSTVCECGLGAAMRLRSIGVRVHLVLTRRINFGERKEKRFAND